MILGHIVLINPMSLFRRPSFILILLVSVFFLGCKNNVTSTLPGKLNKKVSCKLPSEIKFSGENVKMVLVFTIWSLKSNVIIKRFRKLRSLFSPSQVKFALVSIDLDKGHGMVEGWYKQYHPIFPLLHDASFKLCDKKVKSVPVTFIMNKKGRVCYLFSGIIDSNIMYKQIVDSLKNCK